MVQLPSSIYCLLRAVSCRFPFSFFLLVLDTPHARSLFLLALSPVRVVALRILQYARADRLRFFSSFCARVCVCADFQVEDPVERVHIGAARLIRGVQKRCSSYLSEVS